MNTAAIQTAAKAQRKPLPKLKTLNNTKGLNSHLGGQDAGMTLTCRVTLNLCNTHPCPQ
ncbi:MAG: hypothetical protein K2X77_20200 [Candidatus Obscuribacterales bacterium]|nr:hypothetical protein [Candidatus Obscuribacterales bacterium]